MPVMLVIIPPAAIVKQFVQRDASLRVHTIYASHLSVTKSIGRQIKRIRAVKVSVTVQRPVGPLLFRCAKITMPHLVAQQAL